MVSPLDLPSNPTPDQLELIQKYLDQQKKSEGSGYGKQNYYIDKEELFGKKLIIFKHKQKKKDVYYMRFYVGNKKYKQLSLNTSDRETAVQKALDKWRLLQGQIDLGGKVFEITTQVSIDDFIKFLDEKVETGLMKPRTRNCKLTSLKKLRSFLSDFESPSKIPANCLDDYVSWRRTKNWNKQKHPNNPDPPSDQTINKELGDFKGYFDWMKKKRFYVHDIDYPLITIDYKKSVEKNPSFDVEDWISLVYYMRTWIRKTESRKEFGIFYRTIFCEWIKVLGNSGLRPHESLKLRWCDVKLKKKEEVEWRPSGKSEREIGRDLSVDQVQRGGKSVDVTLEEGHESEIDIKGRKVVRERLISHIEVSPDTKTGRRLVICPAGVYFRRIRDFYKEKTGKLPSPNDYIFHNIGTTHSKKDKFMGKPLSTDHFRKLWYELISDFKKDKNVQFQHHYTIYSCRSFFINQRLEMGVPPNFVGKLVGHSVKTMERYYENIQLKNLEPELVEIRKRKLEDADFQLFDLELG